MKLRQKKVSNTLYMCVLSLIKRSQLSLVIHVHILFNMKVFPPPQFFFIPCTVFVEVIKLFADGMISLVWVLFSDCPCRAFSYSLLKFGNWLQGDLIALSFSFIVFDLGLEVKLVS